MPAINANWLFGTQCRNYFLSVPELNRSVGRNLLSTNGFECEIDHTRSDQPIPRVLTSPIDLFLPKRFGRVSRRGVFGQSTICSRQ